MDQRPILIVGLPRSGTTLVEQIVSSHPDVAAGEELPFWSRRGALMEQAGDADPTGEFIRQAAQDYQAFLQGIAADAGRITDKDPFNFLWVGLIHLAFPQAVIVHCCRSTIDTALSIHQTHFHPRLQFPTGGAELVGYVRAYERLMAHWRAVLPSDSFVEVDYQTLTEGPDESIPQLIASLGLSWDKACLSPEQNSRAVTTASKWQVRRPIYGTAIDKWRRYEPYLGSLAALAPIGAET